MKNSTQKLEKIQKILANRGIGSRRQIEQMIEEGKIKVNGRLATLGDRAAITDTFHVNNRIVKLMADEEDPIRVIMYHKPEGEICTRQDPEGRPTIFQQLPKLHRGRWVSIGRLDVSTTGLILLTNSGELANTLMHPKSEIEREYAVRVYGEVDPEVLKRLKQGVALEDGLSQFEEIVFAGGTGKNQWYHVTLRRGKNREVRRLWESQGLTVSRLTRVRFGSLKLSRHLKPGRWEEVPVELVESWIA